MKPVTVLSLFDGIGGCRMALERAGIPVETYYSSEIDPYGIAVVSHNYPDTIHVGDITKRKEWDIDWGSIDIVTGGFSCQSWSVSGKQLGDKDPRGKLFWVMLDIVIEVKKHNPDVSFLFENVNMKQEFQDYLTKNMEKALGKVNKYHINSSLVSAQNRRRIYWTNIDGVKQPKDKEILLKDILDDDVDESYYFEMTKPIKWRSDVPIHHTAEKYRTLRVGGAVPSIRLDGVEDKEIPYFYPDATHRRLTPEECERLQTVTEGYTKVPITKKNGTRKEISPRKRYKMLGNGWTIDVVAHIFKKLK